MNKEPRSYLTVDKPLVFKHKNISKITELIQKQSNNQLSSNDKGNNSEDDDGEMFDAYISQKIKESLPSFNSIKRESKSKIIKKEERVNLIKAKDTDLYQISNEEKKNEEKSTIKYSSYISTISFTQNRINTLENIHNDLLLLLPEPTFQSPYSKLSLLQWIDLSFNKLSSVHDDITRIPYLKILYLDNNVISDLNKITALSQCNNLTTLTLSQNPVCKIRGYRQFIVEMCPVLEKLDNSEVTEKELEIIHFGGSKYGEKRLNGNGKVIRYPNKK